MIFILFLAFEPINITIVIARGDMEDSNTPGLGDRTIYIDPFKIIHFFAYLEMSETGTFQTYFLPAVCISNQVSEF